MSRLSIFYIAAILSLVSLAQGFATTSGSLNRRQVAPSSFQRKSKWTMYMPSSSSNSQPQVLRAVGATDDRGSIGWKSRSVLASCDTLPSFRTAHGLLSPETVYRMNQRTQGGLDNEAVASFLERYRREGPMSCLSMLSDPDVLPHLTEAMRESA
jgi:hypothetical protein